MRRNFRHDGLSLTASYTIYYCYLGMGCYTIVIIIQAAHNVIPTVTTEPKWFSSKVLEAAFNLVTQLIKNIQYSDILLVTVIDHGDVVHIPRP